MAFIKYLVDLDLNKNQLLNAVVQNLAAAPGSPSDGQIYWDTAQDSLFVYNLTGATWIDLGASGVTNLGYTASAANGIVTSNTGDNATLTLATGTNAGLLAPADFTILSNTSGSNTGDNATNTQYSGLVSNVSTNLSEGTTTTTTVNVNSSDGTNATLLSASTIRAGVLSSAKFDEIVANSLKTSDINHNVTTNLSTTTTATTNTVVSSDGTDAILPAATTTVAGMMTGADKLKLDGIENSADVTDATNVNAAGAVMNTDSTTASMSFVIDEDNMISNLATKVPTQQSVKAYVDTEVGTITPNSPTALSTGTVANTTYGITSDGGANDVILAAATTSLSGVMTGTDKTKLNGIEALADVTDATNVNAAGAVMNSDTSTTAMSFVIDEDTLASNSATKVPTQQSVKAYVDGNIAANDAMVFKGTIGVGGTLTLAAFNALVVYDAGWAYKVITAGTYKGIVSEIGDLFIATVDRSSLGVNADWTVVQTNIDGAVVGPASAVTNRVATFNGTSGKLIQDSGLLLSGSNTGDEPAASTTVAGIIELATITETNTGTSTTRAVTPDGLDGWTGSIQITKLGTVGTGTWTAGVIAEAYLQNQSGTNTGDNATNTQYSGLVSDTGVPAILSTGGLPVLNTGITEAEVKTILSLGNVNNTSDANKPVSSAQQTALNLKANIASPTLTGTPAAPTASTGTSTTQIATTAYVKNQGYSTTTGTVKKTQVDCAAATSTTVTHASGQYANVEIYRKLTPFDRVMAQVTSTNATTVVVTFNTAPTIGEYVIIVQG